MKRVLPVILAVLLLTACMTQAPTPIISVSSPAPSAAAVTAVSIPSPNPTAEVVATSTDTFPPDFFTDPPDNLPAFTMSPVQDVGSSGFPPLKNKKVDPGLNIGITAVANNDYLYYYDFSDDHDVLYRQDRHTNAKTKLRVTPEYVLIAQIFLDAAGNLYYLCGGAEGSSYDTLYKYSAKQDLLIADNVFNIIRVDKDFIYYTVCSGSESDILFMKVGLQDGSIHPVAAGAEFTKCLKVRPLSFSDENADWGGFGYEDFQAVDLASGKVYLFPNSYDSYSLSCEGGNLVAFKQNGNGTTFTVYDYSTIQKYTCTLPAKLKNIVATLVQNGHLFVIDCNMNNDTGIATKSNIYDISLNSNTLVSTVSTDYVKSACYYNGTLYLYTTVLAETQSNPALTRQKVRAFDTGSNQLTTIASLPNKNNDDDQDYTFEVTGGYAWMIDYYGADTLLNDCWKKVPIPTVLPTVSPQPTPTPTETPTATEAPTATATSN